MQCLEAFGTADGVEFCRPYPNIVAKAAMEFPKLPELLANALPLELIADAVCGVLDGVALDACELPLPDNLLDESLA